MNFLFLNWEKYTNMTESNQLVVPVMFTSVSSAWYTRRYNSGVMSYKFNLDPAIGYTNDTIVKMVDAYVYLMQPVLHDVLATWAQGQDCTDAMVEFLKILQMTPIMVKKITFIYAEDTILAKCLKIEVYRNNADMKCDRYYFDVVNNNNVVADGILFKISGIGII